MICIFSVHRFLPLTSQCACILFGLVLLYGMPPVRGTILLVPLTAQSRTGLVPFAIEHGAKLVATGPWAGSLLVDGRRDLLALAMLSHGVIPLATSRSGCGGRN